MAAEAKFKLSVQGAARVRGALRGVHKEAKRVSDDQKRASREGERVTQQTEDTKRRAMRQTYNLGKAFSNGQLQEARRSAREQMRLTERVERMRVREAARAAREIEKLRHRMAQRETDGGRIGTSPVRGALIGGAIGAVTGAFSTASKMRGIAGVKSQEQRIQDAADFDMRLRRLGAKGGMSDEERDSLGARISATSINTGLDQSTLLAGMEVAQEKFPQALASLQANLESLATTAMGLEVPFEELVGAAGSAGRSLGLTEKETKRFLEMMAAAGSEGVIDAPEFATHFSKVMGMFSAVTGQSGMTGAREFLGLAEAVGTSGADSSEAATYMQSMLAAISTGPSKDGIIGLLSTGGRKKAGMSKEQAESNRALAKRMRKGESVSLLDVVQGLAADKRFSGVKMHDVLGRKEAALGFEAAVRQERNLVEGKTNTAASRVAQTDSETGAQLIATSFAKVMEGPGATFAKQAAEAQAHVTKNLADYAKHVAVMNDASLTLEEAVGTFGLHVDTFKGALTGLGGGALLTAALGGGGGKAGALLGAGNGASKLAGKGGMVAMAGLVSYGATQAILEATGGDKGLEDFGGWIHDLFNGTAEERVNEKIGEGAKAERETQRQTLKALQAIERNTKQQQSPVSGAPAQQPPVPGRSGR